MWGLVCRVNSWVANMISSAFGPAQDNVFLLPLWPGPTHVVLFGPIRGEHGHQFFSYQLPQRSAA
jgi:hypothetical protein